MVDTRLDAAKQAVREQMWAQLEAANVVGPGAYGGIPAFYGCDAAAERLATLSCWQAATVLKVVPDKPQQPVRSRALADGKLVYMAAPKLAASLPFYLLDPTQLAVTPAEAAVKETAARVARQVGVTDMRAVDLVVTSSVAVNHAGVRLGKGAGYSDIEVALLAQAGLLSDKTVIVTTVHDLQVLDQELPEADHDFRVDYVVTPTRVIATPERKRPNGLSWESLSEEKIAAIPVLAQMANSRINGHGS